MPAALISTQSHARLAKEQPRSLANAIVLTASLTSAPLKWLRSGANNGLQTHRLGHTQNYWHPPLTGCRIAKLAPNSCRTAPTTHVHLHLTIPMFRRAFTTDRYARRSLAAEAATQHVQLRRTSVYAIRQPGYIDHDMYRRKRGMTSRRAA